MNVSINEIGDVIAKELQGYSTAVAENIKNVANNTAKELLNNIKADAPSKSGEYKKAMALKKVQEGESEIKIIWYVKSPHHSLAHLLEYGHAKRNGGRVRAYPHIAKNEAKAKKDFEERVKEVIENGG